MTRHQNATVLLFFTIVHAACVLATFFFCCSWPDCARGEERRESVVPRSNLNGVSAEFFTRRMQPILASHCFSCHGPDKAESGLRFDSRDSATRLLASGHRAVTPGDPGASEILRRVRSADASERMPPKGERLTSEEIAQVEEWIRAGAVWSGHWAYEPLSASAKNGGAEVVLSAWSQTPIDSFILSKLTEQGLSPSSSPSSAVLVRRIYFDLTGLPPTLGQVTEYTTDSRPDAMERLVDRVLASPRLGERSARGWMDLVHFAETHGHDQDRPRDHAWPYRDYLIRAFNDDVPYARFVAEQVAGDVLFPHDPWATIATGFLATGPWDESSLRDIREDTLDREIARYVDRDDIVTTVISTICSTTVGCARCHDHKFDPISQVEYYGLQAIFSATDKANREVDLDPQVGQERRSLLAKLSELPVRRARMDESLLAPDTNERVAQFESQLQQQLSTWVVLKPHSVQSAKGTQFQSLEDGSWLAHGARPDTDTYTFDIALTPGMYTGLKLDVMSDPSLPQKGPGRQDNGNLHLNEIHVRLHSSSDESPKVIPLANPVSDFDQADWTIAKAIDGDQATAWGIFPKVGTDHSAVFELAQPLSINAPGARLTIELHQTHGRGHLIGRPRLSITQARAPLPLRLESLPDRIATVVRTPPSARTTVDRVDLALFVLEREIQGQLDRLPKPSLVYCGTNRFQADGTFRPAPAPRSVYVLGRGEIENQHQMATPGALSLLQVPYSLMHSSDEGDRRCALAQWLIDPRNVLTWRSITNRVWQQHFDRGLVDSPNDFGRMGEIPSHPELLDWLATELVETPGFGWGQGSDAKTATGAFDRGGLKRLRRTILLSSTYQQSSQHSEQLNKHDADNRWLGRTNRRRLDAESVRDAVLFSAGLLNDSMFGPSARQFIQTKGVHVTPNVDYLGFDPTLPANFRRSVYRFVFRTLPDPFMDALDCPDSSQLTPKRTSSVSAVQALAMLNDKGILFASQKLAELLESDISDAQSRIEQTYVAILNRLPTDEEAGVSREFVHQHGLANLCRLLWNTNEFIFLD